MSRDSFQQTPSQTAGPFFSYGLVAEQTGYPFSSLASSDMASDDTDGEAIRIEGQVFDGNGVVVSDALIELWQADAKGRYAHPADSRASNAAFSGFGRCGTVTDSEHRFWFNTVKPGAPDEQSAPHVNVIIFMRGLLNHAYTRIYFEDEATANASDPVLNLVPDERRNTLIAKREVTQRGVVYRFDIRMQGEHETVFFDV